MGQIEALEKVMREIKKDQNNHVLVNQQLGNLNQQFNMLDLMGIKDEMCAQNSSREAPKL